jgi:hypothetical protein
MTVLVRQNTAGTTQLNGTAPDPINVPGNTWYASVPARFLRSASGGVLIPDSAFWYGLLSYNVATARQKITISNAVLLTGSDYINLNINASTQTANVYSSGTGYFVQIQPAAGVRIYEWSGAGGPTGLGTASAALPSSPITVSSAYIEHLTSGTLNASVTVGGTTYTTTATVGSPLAGAYAGLYTTSGASGGITASEIQIENDVAITYTYARPSSDITTQWTPSTAGPHYALIDEVTYNDADYIYATAAAQTDEVGLQAMSIPTAGTDVLVNYRVQGITGGGSVTVSLYTGTTLVKTDTTRTANNTSPAYYTMTVTAAEWGAVAVNWSNMRLRFVSA